MHGLGMMMAGSNNAPYLLSVSNYSEAGVNDATLSIPLPAVVRQGDVLLVLQYTEENVAVTWDETTAGTWPFGGGGNINGFGTPVYVWRYRLCDGTEGGKTLLNTFSANALQKYARIFHIRAAASVTADLGSYVVSSNAPNPPAANWGVVDATLVMAAYFAKNAQTGETMTPPAGYSDASAFTGNFVVSIGAAFRSVVASTEDPGAFALSVARDHRALTFTFR